jgi:cytochrome c oxidase cbb3-type subunit III
VLSDDGVAKVADYVLALSNGAATDGEGATQFRTYCSACHGPDGAGMALLGAPALNDRTWQYGGSIADVRASIALGRTGVMPAFGTRLDATQVKLLTAWLTNGAQPLRGQ